MKLNNKILKEIRKAPELSGVEIVSGSSERIEITFKPGTQRTGKELLKVQSILFDNEIYNFIKSEKVSFWDNVIKTISISFY